MGGHETHNAAEPYPAMLVSALTLKEGLADARAGNRADGTLHFYRHKLVSFSTFVQEQGVDQVADLAPRHIRMFMDALADGHTPGGSHAYWRAVRAFVRFLVREGALERDPLRSVRPPKVDEELLEPVEPEVVQALLATCDRSLVGLRDAAALMVLLDSGLRAGELIALNIDDVDLQSGAIIVRHSKSRRPRTVFVGRKTRNALRAYRRVRPSAAPDDPLFVAQRHGQELGRLSYTALRDAVRRRASRAGVPAPTLHSFRRGFAINMLRSGADIVSLSRLMGHGSLPIVMCYLRQERGDLAGVHAARSPVDALVRASGRPSEWARGTCASRPIGGNAHGRQRVSRLHHRRTPCSWAAELGQAQPPGRLQGAMPISGPRG